MYELSPAFVRVGTLYEKIFGIRLRGDITEQWSVDPHAPYTCVSVFVYLLTGRHLKTHYTVVSTQHAAVPRSQASVGVGSVFIHRM